jgi:hypothetical protein
MRPAPRAPDNLTGRDAGTVRAFDLELQPATVIPTLERLAGERALTGRLLPVTTRALLDLARQRGADAHRTGQPRARGVAATEPGCHRAGV